MKSLHTSLSRRKFLKASGGITFGITAVAMLPKWATGSETASGNDRKQVNAWVHIQPDGKIIIYNPAAEMGQGSMTALPVIFAEEMDADWADVTIEHSPIDVDTYGLKKWGDRKIMLTVGSFTVKSYFDLLRQAGAQARYILMYSVAQAWKVPMNELHTKPSKVVHKASGKSISYGDIVEIIDIPTEIPEIPEEQMKRPEDFRLIGSVMPRFDIPAKVDGSAKFSIDVKVPGMVYAVMERGKVHGAKPNLTNRDEILRIEGVEEVVEMEYGVGVITKMLEQALAAKKLLKIDWDDQVTAKSHNCQQAYDQYAAVEEKGEMLKKEGNFEEATNSAAKTYEAAYKNDYVYHAQMEPLNAIASVAPDGKSAEIWAGTQNAGTLALTVANMLRIDESDVTFHPHYLGGGLGRRSVHDYIEEAVALSNTVKKPVKLIWTREDDLTYGRYRPLSLQRMKATVNGEGKLTGFSHIIVGDGSNLLASGARNEFYDIPHQHLELRTVDTGIRLKHWRSVGHGPNKFAIESFIDEIAMDQGVDPLEFRRRLMKPYPRAWKVVETVAEMANWGAKVEEGRAKGLAFGERSGALCAGVCELSVDRATGKIRVHRFWSAVDAGIVVQPDNVVAQMEGGILMGISSVLQERVSIKAGEIQESNFHNYRLLRFEDVPESIDIEIIPSMESPQGIGEASLPVVGGAISNAFAALTGKRLRHLPFTAERVMEVLE